MKLANSVAVITGGARGIGKAITKSLLQNRAKVYFLDLDVTEGKIVQKNFEDEFGKEKATFLECDVTDTNKIEGILSNIVKENGHLDILCNNAGTADGTNIDKMISINLTSVIHGTLLGVKYMDKNNGGKGGCIVNMASEAGLVYRASLTGPTGAYTASKHGVVGYTRAFAKNAIMSGVRLNCICPSFVDTDMVKYGISKSPEMKAAVEKLGCVSSDTVAEGFIQLLNDEEKVGEAMTISAQHGIGYHDFPANL
ncbi:15-hydroxyprostaglandin dehydrogenase [NAD(+)]-like isoform X2 [Dendronephthya gigantea]|uniref:15-hydroxyprostaglandin dehydrogenase [NAD(+)]-like isoform X2 n=1 Tax=Dendronephthya gigantea TaxID=151771 RepID=UPI00106DB069|nr:15-hydroxyprostaglandin dehydrogenase [NAD(+)]-like isoform X2 [Dendronephthya gigantea]